MRRRLPRKITSLAGCIAALFLVMTSLCAEEESAPGGKALTLLDCYNLSLLRMETIAIDAQRIKEAEAHFLQAMAILMPYVSFVSNDGYIDTHRATNIDDVAQSHAYERKFTFQQAIFSGFKDFAAMNASRYEKKQRQKEKERAEQLLFGDVSDSFYLFLQQQEDLVALQSVEKDLTDRIGELDKRIDLGRSRKSEVAMVRVQVYSVEAELESIKSQRDLARQLLEFYTGVPIQSIEEPQDILNSVKPINYYSALARKRADIIAAENATAAARANIQVAQSGYLPTVDLLGDAFAGRNTVPKKASWDALISVNVPLFQGTQVLGNVKQARALEEASRLQWELTDRQSQTEVQEAYTALRYALSRRGFLNKALDAAGENYNLQRRDYDHNLVSNLDVLAAIQSLADAWRSLIQATSIAKRAYWQLWVASGQTIKDQPR